MSVGFFSDLPLFFFSPFKPATVFFWTGGSSPNGSPFLFLTGQPHFCQLFPPFPTFPFQRGRQGQPSLGVSLQHRWTYSWLLPPPLFPPVFSTTRMKASVDPFFFSPLEPSTVPYPPPPPRIDPLEMKAPRMDPPFFPLRAHFFCTLVSRRFSDAFLIF